MLTVRNDLIAGSYAMCLILTISFRDRLRMRLPGAVAMRQNAIIIQRTPQ